MSRIEKIKRYNQYVLAVAGSIGIILLLVAALLTLKDLSHSFFPPSEDATSGILATEQTDELVKDSLRKQIISFNKIQVIDSINQTYLLPVTQSNLANAESINRMNGLLNTKSVGKNYKKFYGNIYNNLILFKAKTAESKVIFNNRISIEEFIIHDSGSNKYVVIPCL